MKKKEKKYFVTMVVLVVVMGWLFVNPKVYNRLHGEWKYQVMKKFAPDWIAGWYDPSEYDIKER